MSGACQSRHKPENRGFSFRYRAQHRACPPAGAFLVGLAGSKVQIWSRLCGRTSPLSERLLLLLLLMLDYWARNVLEHGGMLVREDKTMEPRMLKPRGSFFL
jgi:hypothetical protein